MRIREAVVAGQFYPGGPDVLRREVLSHMSGSGQEPDDAIVGVVSPHAGYVYSGRTAGAAFAAAPAGIERVVIIAPSHRFGFPGASVFAGDEYRTPLGSPGLDRELIDMLLERGLTYQPAAHFAEHSAEVQVPFVQVRYPEASLCVLVQGSQSSSSSIELGKVLHECTSALPVRTLLVASSDMSHYHSLEEARHMDSLILSAFEAMDSVLLAELLITRKAEACGGGPIMTLLEWARRGGSEGLSARVLAYDTSASASGDTGQVVGYFAGAVSRRDG
ncbi:AmmeMemoRadiSam system protein B [Candidatus Fermentibacterales bacterium]|nr:AmmeMemoRadiSam system protein B [Candidatus Fermentibacterales bacterium]